MKIGGLEKLTLIDYPQKIACTVFLSGCNFRCPWCYSSELVLPEKIENHPEIKEEDLFSFLRKRKGKLDGVVLCGGEPTVHSEIFHFAEKIKKEGFLVKLDTNGSNPIVIREMIKENLLDYIAMDVKGPLERYEEFIGVKIDTEKIKESINLIMNGKKDYEFRTTLIPGMHKKEDIKNIGKTIKGAKKYFLQNFLPEKTLYGEFLKKKPFSKEDILSFKKEVSSFVNFCEIRN